MRRTLCRFTFFCVMILSIGVGFAQDTNIVRNGGFEDRETNDVFFWTKGSWNQDPKATIFAIDEDEKHSGNMSMSIENKIENDSRFKQVVEVKPATYYRLSCWVKTNNVGLDKKGANISADGITETSRDITGTTGEWEYIEIFGKTGKEQNSFLLTLGLGGYGSINTGKVWFDDVVVEEAPSLPVGKTAINLFTNDSAQAQTTDKDARTKILFSAMFLILIIVGLVVFLFPFKKLKRNSRNSDVTCDDTNAGKENAKENFCKKDVVIITIMTAIYLAIALINLGTLNFPQTSWTPRGVGENFTIDLGKSVSLSRIYYNCGLGDGREPNGKFRVLYQDKTGEYKHFSTLDKKDIFIWKYLDVPPIKVSKLKVIVDVPGGSLNEIGFFEEGSKEPLKDIKIIEKDISNRDAGDLKNLFDEQGTIPLIPSYLNGMYFDEIYHARTAFEHLNHIEPFETTHPPLGKIFISIGVAIFGMVPFGWRIPGTIFGAAMIPLMYIFGKKMFKERFYGFVAAFLMMFDFMHFTQTRIATIDVFVTFFIILMYYYMYDYISKKSYLLDFKQSIKPLFLCGLCLGLGASSKWIALYGALGLAVLFFQAKYWEFGDYLQVKNNKKIKKPEWFDKLRPVYINKTLLYCLMFFVAIPAAIYFLSYIPYMMVPGEGHGINIAVKNSMSMYDYHKNLKATHPYQSQWWEWPLMIRPMCYYIGNGLANKVVSNITSMGNPAVWWGGLVAIVASLIIQLRKRNKKDILLSLTALFFIIIALLIPSNNFIHNLFLIISFVFLLLIFKKQDCTGIFLLVTAVVFQYIPWILIPRIAFIYHYFSIVPFMILIIVYIFKKLNDKYPGFKNVIYLYLFVVAMLFIMFYPVISGAEVSSIYTKFLRWGKYWYF